MKFFVYLMTALLICTSVGCGTIMNGGSAKLSVNSNEVGATVTIDGKAVGTTPWTGSIKKKSNGSQVIVSKSGFNPSAVALHSETDVVSTWLLNILLGGLYGGPLSTTTDYATGGAYKYSPSSVFANLTPVGGVQPAQPQVVVVQQTPTHTPPAASHSTQGIDRLPQAITRVSYSATQDLRERSRIAIMSVTAPDRNMRDFITGELEIAFRNHNYRIIDRSQLDRIREEQKFQLSGEVDDNTAVSIGKIAGADYIVTCRVDGEGAFRRLRIRILDTQTAEVVGAGAEPF